jgi:hypothetical protein
VVFLFYRMLTICDRGFEHSTTPMPGIGWESKSPLKDLIPIELSAGPRERESLLR